ncbi:MAG: aminotransferase class V-fold PLP-dependent enzyme [Defluviitaleaceae bacterium]|nr:aminotransferase class V-fold PLP-dependent enzyme [Defluviitaleaceae bacterium]
MRKVYADNSSTSFPKAPGVSDSIKDFLDNVGCNVNRGGYEASYNTALEILEARKLLCGLFNFNEPIGKPRNVIFTPGITYSINMILQGFLKENDHIITTSMEHNGVMRPLHELSERGVDYSMAECEEDGTLDPQKIASLFTAKTKAVIMTHASNVSGTVLPIREVYEICAPREIKLIIDTAQTAGELPIDMSYADAIAFTAHKGLLAAQGLGGFIIKSDFAKKITPIITGGTGSKSHEILQPDLLPDKFEAGTINIPAIIGLKKALEYIKAQNPATIHAKKMKLTERFLQAVRDIPGVVIIGKKDLQNRISTVSLNFKTIDNAEIAALLDSDYGIMTRCGLHCAPVAHKTLKTYPHGTVRFSFGYFNTPGEIDYIAQAIKEIVR